ncbi:MAG: zinc ribbon domain-containing protein [Thaumarchaeota archaeon]|nr:zinc ribbon domain-containing protein [Nitrososphaerota archaeon]
MPACTKCGSANSDDSQFCSACGAPLKVGTTPYAPPAESDEKILGSIAFAASTTNNYTVYHVIFTDRQVVGVPPSSSKDWGSLGAGSSVAMWLAGMNPSGAFGASGLLGLRSWNNLKKSVAGKPLVQLGAGNEPFTGEMLKAAKFKLPYEKIKDVSFKKIMMSSDYLLNIGAGFLATQKLAIDVSCLEDAKSLVKRTSLAQKLKE